jgi:hypothetical protein
MFERVAIFVYSSNNSKVSSISDDGGCSGGVQGWFKVDILEIAAVTREN